MKALVYRGPRNVRIEEVSDPRIEEPTDVIVRITTTNICESDLHMYEGRTNVEEGKVLGHENLGEVIEVGKAVKQIKKGDLVCLPFNISCGSCKNSERGLTGFCLTANPGNAGAAYGYAGMGPYNGGQAEYLRVPYADFNCLKLPEDARDRQADYVMLSNLIHTERARPSWIVSHELSLEEAPKAYGEFDCRNEGWTKVILHPGGKRESRSVQHEVAGKRELVASGKNGH